MKMTKMHKCNCENMGTYVCPEGELGCCSVTGEILATECQACVGDKNHTHVQNKMLEDKG